MGSIGRLVRHERTLVVVTFALALAGLLALHAASTPQSPLSASAAITAARADTQTARYLATHHADHARSIPLDEADRRVTFFDGPRVVLDVAVGADARVDAREEHPGGVPELGAELAHRGWLMALLSAVFLIAVGVVPLRRMRNLDALALAAFGGTVVLLDDRLVTTGAALGSVLLAYLAARCLYLGLRAPHASRQTPVHDRLTAGWESRRGQRLMHMITGATLLVFLAVTLTSAGESDVAAATLSGATGLLHGELPYGHVTAAFHGDSYGPLAYLLYLPGALWTPVTDAWSDLTGALAVTAIAAIAAGLALRRIAGPRALLAWLAFPPVLLTASTGANDLVLAAVLAWALALWMHARRSMLLLVAAAWIKVVPLILVPVWLARGGRRDPRVLVPAGALSLALTGGLLGLGGLHALAGMARGVAFQFHRGSFHAPWHAFGLTWLQPVVQAAVLAALALSFVRLMGDPLLRHDPARVAALCAGLLFGVQLGANYWTWAYLTWVLPFVLVALLGRERRQPAQLVRTKTGHLPGTPLSSWSPRNSNSRPEPTTVP